MSKFMDELMAEHIRLPGVPQLVVTRDFAYCWMRDQVGFDPREKGYGSIDYAVFSQKPLDEPLTDLEPLQGFLEGVAQSMRRDCLGL